MYQIRSVLKGVLILKVSFDIFKSLKKQIQTLFFKYNWRKLNRHNRTSVSNMFKEGIVQVGNNSYGEINAFSWRSNNEGLNIGHYVSISSGVKFILGGNHHTSGFTTFPFKSIASAYEPNIDASSKGKIIIGDDTWIGTDSIILSGVTVGRGCVIAAGSVVTKSFPNYSVIGGNPARFIKFRLNDAEIAIASKVNFEHIDINNLSDENVLGFYAKPTEEALSKIVL
jgi:acetyltransferase-like isoleucine patch superfamily enzyme